MDSRDTAAKILGAGFNTFVFSYSIKSEAWHLYACCCIPLIHSSADTICFALHHCIMIIHHSQDLSKFMLKKKLLYNNNGWQKSWGAFVFIHYQQRSFLCPLSLLMHIFRKADSLLYEVKRDSRR